ncbi:MAG: hypothetical protein ACI8PB_003620 [Desulforhopalus sp.]|jgi:hypothetical protein
MKSPYTLDQIIDLEYFLHEDSPSSPEELHLRDREIARTITGNESTTNIPTQELLSGWIQTRLENEFKGESNVSPGTLFSRSRSLASTLITFKGLIAGLFAGWAFFAYAGTTPINVLQFLLFFVFSQLFITGLLFAGLCAKKLIPGLKLPGTRFYLLYSLGKKLFVFINRKWFENISGNKRESVRHAYGIIKSKNQLYGSLFYWPIFSLAQLFGITFNIGLLTTTFTKIITSDLAFGWQSTLQLSNSAIEKMVHLLALPWGWLLPSGIGSPTLAEIQGSHIILKDGIYHLTTGDLVAWWPFLLLCLLFYGLLIRIVFYISGRFMENNSLAALDCNTPQCTALLRRMTTPVVSTQAVTEQTEKVTKEAQPSPSPGPRTSTVTLAPQVLLIPGDIFDTCDSAAIDPLMKTKGFEVIEKHCFMLGYDEDQILLQTLEKRSWDNTEGVTIIMESWMVPLVDFLVFLKDVRLLSTPTTTIEIALTGEAGDTVFTDVRPTDMEIWRKKIESIGDPYIHLAPITGIST